MDSPNGQIWRPHFYWSPQTTLQRQRSNISVSKLPFNKESIMKFSRRMFSKRMLQGLSFLALGSLFKGVDAFAKPKKHKKAGGALGKKCDQMIDMTKKKRTDANNTAAVATATAIGYIDDANHAKNKKEPSAKCESCMFFKGVDKGCGTCQLIPNVQIHAEGYCNSWTKKA